uniref:Uncharacterized protein n=1 Tax=Pithovirus LCPAC302 TaxID=2506593 RepID=A0A481Z8A7_9VIRU|nr:MAG: hypothetical protein LCPAC302_02320 [Pithovirus LCPAC302]
MRNILGIVYAKSESDVTLEKEDWKSAINAIDVHLKRKDWDVNIDHYKCNDCEVQAHVFENPSEKNEDSYEVAIKGTCSDDFDYKTVIEDILNVLKNRYILLVGSIYLSSATDPIDIDLVLVCSEDGIVKVSRLIPETF